jgi:hypothetical protein
MERIVQAYFIEGKIPDPAQNQRREVFCERDKDAVGSEWDLNKLAAKGFGKKHTV